nr:PREDICTED: cytokine receptor common subunit gamma [Apteryx mantelli mantelli]
MTSVPQKHRDTRSTCKLLKGVECILFNEEYMTCTWGSRETLTTNFSLYYWAGRAARSRGRRSPGRRLCLAVKPEAPVNLTIHNLSSNQLQLTWSSPYPKAQCLEHAVKYKSNKDTTWTEHKVKGEIFSFPSVDYEKYYTFYVRSKINSYCGSTQLWSEWSVPVVWGNNATSEGTAEEQLHWFWIHTVLIPITSCLLLLVLVILLVRMERVWVIFMPRIPNPSKNFDELFITHKGNLEEWTGVPKDVVESFKPNYNESVCYVSELPPKESYEPFWGSTDQLLAVPGAPAFPQGPKSLPCSRPVLAALPRRAGRWALTPGVLLQAAARHRCRYLVNLHVLQFLRAGGDPQWLRGLDFIPPKLRNLSEINKILAHRPWLVTKEHIEKLLKISEWSWSLAELVHAVVLLAHCHALASFVFGCGCEQEEGPGGRGTLKPLSPGNQCFCEAASGNGCTQELLRIGRKRSLDSCMELDSLRERIQRIHLEAEGREETRLLQQDREEDLVGEVTGATNLACYMQDPDFGYQDFARRDEDQTQVFRVQDYSWEDHGFSLVNRLYSDIGHLLDEKFRMVDGLQSSAMAKRQGCEPSVFKRGIWNYIHCMFGIRYDDYDYAEVNHLLERMLKVYIKTVTCYPEKTNPEMFDRFWKQFKHSEKVHVNLLILEARMQAELLYALQAITQYMVS